MVQLNWHQRKISPEFNTSTHTHIAFVFHVYHGQINSSRPRTRTHRNFICIDSLALPPGNLQVKWQHTSLAAPFLKRGISNAIGTRPTGLAPFLIGETKTKLAVDTTVPKFKLAPVLFSTSANTGAIFNKCHSLESNSHHGAKISFGATNGFHS